MCGENPLQALDFKKHYRLDAAHLVDPTYMVSRAYQAGSWPTTVIVGPNGEIAGRWRGVTEPANWAAAKAKLDELIPRAKGGPPKGAYCTGDRCFVRSDRDIFEYAPTMAADGSGRAHLVFTRETGGTGDLYHQILDNGSWGEPLRITRSTADDYSPALCADGERGLRLVWCSDRAASGKYDVWTKRFDGAKWSPAEHVTKTDDDAAHPRPAVDTQGNFWVTYYRWIPWGENRSRDREVFVRYHDGKTWSAEAQVSPTNVPAYEDHTDPAIAADNAGNVWIAWAWDTHPKEDWPYPPTYGSAIFTRQLRAGQPPSLLQMAGVRSRSLQAAQRTAHWAFMPEVYCLGAEPWFVFEAHIPCGEHAAAITKYIAGEGFPAPDRLSINTRVVCTPRFVEDRNGKLYALWSAEENSSYTVRVARRDQNGTWSEPRLAWAEPKASLRHAAAAFDADNKLWIAAVKIEPGKTRVVVRQVKTP